MSPSGDTRVACAINNKNDGEQYIVRLAEKLSLSPGRYAKKCSLKKDFYSKKRYAYSLTQTFKKRRLFLKKRKTELRNKKELSEGSTYEPDVGLLDLDVVLSVANIDDKIEPIVVLFDLETGGLSKCADILQISVKFQDFIFSVYIKPSQKINEEASLITGLRYDDGHLTLHGNIIETVSLIEAMIAFYEFLYSLKKKCVLTAHNVNFDYPRLLQATKTTFMEKHYRSIILGFADTLPLIKKCTKKKGKGQNKLETVAQSMNIDTSQAHNALDDVLILDKVLENFNITHENIIKHVVTIDEIDRREKFAKELPSALQQLNALNECRSLATRKKIVAARISFNMIVEAYEKDKFIGLQNLFGKDDSNNTKVTANRTVVRKVHDYLEKKFTPAV